MDEPQRGVSFVVQYVYSTKSKCSHFFNSGLNVCVNISERTTSVNASYAVFLSNIIKYT